MKVEKMTIIGGGNLGTAIANGLLTNELIKPSQPAVTRRRTSLLSAFEEQDVRITKDNQQVVRHANIVFLAAKPYQQESVVKEFGSALSNNCIIIPLSTGISSSEIQSFCPLKLPIFRAMPNTAIEIGESMTCISAFNASEQKEKQILALF